jgi:hypothetical protein
MSHTQVSQQATAAFAQKNTNWADLSPLPSTSAEETMAASQLWGNEFTAQISNPPASRGIEETVLPEVTDIHNEAFEIIPQTGTSHHDKSQDDFSSFRDEAQQTQASAEDIRQIVRDEIERALNGHFKDKLNDRLQDVLKMIDRHSK